MAHASLKKKNTQIQSCLHSLKTLTIQKRNNRELKSTTPKKTSNEKPEKKISNFGSNKRRKNQVPGVMFVYYVWFSSFCVKIYIGLYLLMSL